MRALTTGAFDPAAVVKSPQIHLVFLRQCGATSGGGAAVRGPPDPPQVLAVGCVGAGDELPGIAAAGVERGVEHIGVGGIERQQFVDRPDRVDIRHHPRHPEHR